MVCFIYRDETYNPDIPGHDAPFPFRGDRRDTPSMDEDFDSYSRDELLAEVIRLRNGIRRHRDSIGHELYWHHPDLWGLLDEQLLTAPRMSGEYDR